MHSVIMEEGKHDRREDILMSKHTKEEKHTTQTIPGKTVTKWMHILSIL